MAAMARVLRRARLLLALVAVGPAAPTIAQGPEPACRVDRSWPLEAARLTERVDRPSLEAGRVVLVWRRDGGRACVGIGAPRWVDARVVGPYDAGIEDVHGEWSPVFGREGSLTIGPGMDGAGPMADGFLQSAIGHGSCADGTEFHVYGGEMVSGHVTPDTGGDLTVTYEPDVSFEGQCASGGFVRSADRGRRCRASLRQFGPFLALKLAEGCGTDGADDSGMVIFTRQSDDPPR
jgi:hypothetical protein